MLIVEDLNDTFDHVDRGQRGQEELVQSIGRVSHLGEKRGQDVTRAHESGSNSRSFVSRKDGEYGHFV